MEHKSLHLEPLLFISETHNWRTACLGLLAGIFSSRVLVVSIDTGLHFQMYLAYLTCVPHLGVEVGKRGHWDDVVLTQRKLLCLTMLS